MTRGIGVAEPCIGRSAGLSDARRMSRYNASRGYSSWTGFARRANERAWRSRGRREHRIIVPAGVPAKRGRRARRRRARRAPPLAATSYRILFYTHVHEPPRRPMAARPGGHVLHEEGIITPSMTAQGSARLLTQQPGSSKSTMAASRPKSTGA